MAADISVCPGVSKNEYQDNSVGKGGRCVGVTTLPPSCAKCLAICSLNRPEPSGPHRPVIDVEFLLRIKGGQKSSVGIATRYSLLVGGRFSAPVQTGPGAHQASCTMGTGSFPGVKRPGRGAEPPLQSSVPRS